MATREQFKYFLQDSIRKTIHFGTTEQSRGVPPPAIQKPCRAGAKLVDLPPPETLTKLSKLDVVTAIQQRRSHRKYSPAPLTLDELALMLWSTQGVQKRLGPHATLRTVPSAGARHSLESYICVDRVDGLSPGLYRYLPLDHKLVLEDDTRRMDEMATACLGQQCVANSAVTFAWTTVPGRMEWRYELAAYRVILLDAGHVCQNLYLAAEAIACGVCAIGAYDQEAVDALLQVDGDTEFAIYLASVGKR